jgi:tRNA-dependent cyclodipeptide synthase
VQGMKAEYINIEKGEVESKKFNIFIGISLGNLFFSKENLRGYVLWALKYTCEDVVVMIADDIQAVNYQTFKELNEEEALVKARELGEEKEITVRRIISVLPEKDRNSIKIIKWKDVASEEYSRKVGLIFEEFEKNEKFRKTIVGIVSSAFGDKMKDIDESGVLKLSEYVLNELPLMIEGLNYGNKFYSVMPYPRKTPLDDFILGVHDGRLFPELFSKIIKNKKLAVVLK